ncbi:MAG: hypothetical protein RH862_12625 [Leptospiraceae bacterium]
MKFKTKNHISRNTFASTALAQFLSRSKYLAVLTLIFLSGLPSLHAKNYTPFQFSLLSPFQLFDPDTVVVGFRYNVFYGEVDSIYGLDVGFINQVDDISAGLGVGAVNLSDVHAGVQAGLFNFTNRLVGLQIGIANGNDKQYGWQLGLFNFTDEAYLPMVGLALNHGDRAYLGQFTLGVNDMDEGPGIQLAGLGNLNQGNSFLQIAGGINVSEASYFQLSGLFSQSNSGFIQLSGLGTHSEDTWLQTSLGWNSGKNVDLQFPGAFNLSENSRLQLGVLGNRSQISPVQLAGIGNYSNQSTFQFAGLINVNGKGSVQISSLSNLSESADLQFSLLNNGDQIGTQLGLMNNTNLSKCIQLGVFNRSELQTGLSIGLVNDAENLNGFQIGLFNIARNAPIPFTLIFNMHSGHDGPRKTGYIDTSWTPFQLALYMPGQLFVEDSSVHGLRLNVFYGVSKNINGLDVGFLNFSGPINGIQLGAGHVVNGDVQGIQAGLTAVTTGSFRGLSINPLVAYTEGDVTGLSISLGSWTEGSVQGLQLGLVVNRLESSSFPQIGGLNVSREVPLQIGWLGNFAEFTTPMGQFSPLVNINMQDSAMQLSGFMNQARIVPAIQLAGLWNNTSYAPIQIGGLYNQANMGSWLQISLGSNRVLGRNVANDSDFNPELALYDPSGLDGSLISVAQISAFYNESHNSMFQLAFVNNEQEHGVLQAGVFNWSEENWVQAGLLNFSDEPGFQIGLVNGAWRGHSAQLGMINLSYRGNVLSVGLWNMAQEADGLMLGLFNYAEDLNGMQIGLINVHENGIAPLTFGLNF